MTPRLPPLVACALSLLLGTATQAQNAIETRFAQLDQDGDGRLSLAELAASPAVLATLQGADVNQDGFFSREEVARHFTPKTPPQIVPPTVDGPLFRRIDIPGVTDIAEGTNGIALADLNHDGLVDLVATYTEPNRGLSNKGHHLRVFINQGGFRFQQHPITIRESPLTSENIGPFPQIPNLADFDGDGLLDLFITRHSPFWAGKRWPGVDPLGNTLLVSDGAWDTFRDVSAKLGLRNETAYNRQSSLADVNGDGWLDIAIGCDNVGNAIGGVSHSRLYVFQPNGAKFEDGRFEDIGGSTLVPDFGGFYHDPAKDKAGPGIALRDLDNDGDLDLVQSFHCDVRQPLLPYSPGEYRQGMFCWKNLRTETGQLRFEKITANGLACEARLNYNRDKQVYEPATEAKAPGLPYLFFADVDNDGLQDVLAIGPSDPGFAPRAEDVGGRFWRNQGQFQYKEATSEVGFDALNWTYREWYRFFGVAIPPAAENWKPKSLPLPARLEAETPARRPLLLLQRHLRRLRQRRLARPRRL